ncbi:MAG: hypothetical protein N2316_10505 [Spirochaetes bacterium]|nr:hypothetical protein [Spirochaetota bacterium]
MYLPNAANKINFAHDWLSTDEKSLNGQADCFVTCIKAVPNTGWSGSVYSGTKKIGGSSPEQGKALLVREGAGARYLYIAGDYLS